MPLPTIANEREHAGSERIGNLGEFPTIRPSQPVAGLSTTEGFLEPARLPKVAGRISDQEYEDLLDQQATLAAKMVDEGLSHREALQLRLVRWALNQADSVRHGAALDQLEHLTQLHESIARDINRMISSIKK